MIFGGAPFSNFPFAAIEFAQPDDEPFKIFLDLEIRFPVSLVFFGDIGEVIILPPDIIIPPVNMNDRQSPCVLYEN